MADTSQAATALLTEHLQYTPLSLIDDIINSVNNLVYQGVGSLETGLVSTPPERLGFKPSKITAEDGTTEHTEYPEAKKEVEEGLHKLETLLNATVDKNFDKFEIYVLRNVLSLPAELVNWLRLAHYEGVAYPPPENVPTVDDVQLLRQKVAASRMVSRTLLEEQRRNEAALQQLRGLAGTTQEGAGSGLSFLTDGSSARTLAVSSTPGQQPLTTSTTFALAQLPALKALLADLRPKLAALRQSAARTSTATDDVREERRAYIEQRTRSHLHQSGSAGADHSAALPGKRVDPEEVQALEKVASMFDPT